MPDLVVSVLAVLGGIVLGALLTRRNEKQATSERLLTEAHSMTLLAGSLTLPTAFRMRRLATPPLWLASRFIGTPRSCGHFGNGKRLPTREPMRVGTRWLQQSERHGADWIRMS